MTTAMTVHSGEPPVGKALEVRRPAQLLRPIAPAADVITAQNEARDLVAKALVEGRDYGKIPGTGDKPTLLKPGAERLALAFGLTAQFRLVEKEIDHDRVNKYIKTVRGEEQERTSYGLYRYVIECTLLERATGDVVGSAIASCSTLEAKYISRPRDSENTVIKMATKRAHIGATLNSLGLSEQFTQDVEDLADNRAAAAGEQQAASSSSAPAPAQDPAIDASCPKCGGAMWDNRLTKKSPKAPDFKCRDRSCDGVIWPPKEPKPATTNPSAPAAEQGTLAWAAALPLMGKATSWKVEGLAYGGKPIGDCHESALKQARHFFSSKIEEDPNDPRAAAMRDQVAAIKLVLDDRAANPAQTDAFSAPAAEPAPERVDTDADVPQSPPPAPAPAPVAAGRPIDDDDDLPF